uniref:Uncharacterized protein n=1 Tax=Romanomermis culicivorax TaxID=13658 RepID=A0A915IJB4_ROMCU
MSDEDTLAVMAQNHRPLMRRMYGTQSMRALPAFGNCHRRLSRQSPFRESAREAGPRRLLRYNDVHYPSRYLARNRKNRTSKNDRSQLTTENERSPTRHQEREIDE